MTEYNVKYGARFLALNFEGETVKVVFDANYRVFSIRNCGDSTFYVSFTEDIEPDGDGTYNVEPDTTVNIAYVKRSNAIYIKGTGKAEINVSNIYVPVKEGVSTGSGGPGGDVEITTNEDVDELFKD